MGASGNDVIEATRAGDADAVRASLAADPTSAEQHDEHGVSALLLALYHRQPLIAQLLSTARGAKSLTVHEAAALGEMARLAQLLDCDADEHLKWTTDGFNALHLACFFGQETAVDLLLEHGAAVTFAARNPMKVQPLHSAASIGNVAICSKLIARGADVDAVQEGGFTPLMAAAHAGNLALLELLLDHGAKPTLSSGEGKTALELARDGGHQDAVDRLALAAG